MLRIAAAQTVVSPDIAANGSAIRAMIARAAGEGARLINFCEGALSGYAKSQILKQGDWQAFDWAIQEAELRAIAELCGQLRIVAVVGGPHRLGRGYPPHNSLYVFSDTGALLTRYDKRFLSNTELAGWYTPGTEPVMVDVDGYRFGCAICIESQFPEIFSDYERLGVDGVLFASYGLPCRPELHLDRCCYPRAGRRQRPRRHHWTGRGMGRAIVAIPGAWASYGNAGPERPRLRNCASKGAALARQGKRRRDLSREAGRRSPQRKQKRILNRPFARRETMPAAWFATDASQRARSAQLCSNAGRHSVRSLEV